MNYNGWDKEYLENKNAYSDLFHKVMKQDNDSGVEFLEERIAEYSGRSYAVAVNSATDALYYSLLCYGIGTGDEVLVSDFSWISSASCITMTGATPVFCDIDLDSYHISFDEIKKRTTSKTKALIYTHLFGNMTNTTHIEKYCHDNNIIFIEDAAQSLGSSLNGVKAGSIGDVSSYSFNNNKVIAGISGGGMFMTYDKDKAEYVKKLRRHGKGNDFELLGYNSKMFHMNAAFINFRLDKMYQWQSRRQDIASEYEYVLNDLPVQIQKNDNGLDHNYHKYTVRFESKEVRDRVKDKLKAQVHYDKPISGNSMYNGPIHTTSLLVSNSILSLPIHPWLTSEDINKILIQIEMLI